MFGRIKVEPSDKYFSQYIRLRDKGCVRCHSKVEINDAGLPISHQCSHFWSRSYRSTRFEPLNADTVCFNCHRWWESEGRPEYVKFKKKQLGNTEYKILDYTAHSVFKKKDKKLETLITKTLLESIK
jgi:hypothetical protein